MALAAIPVCLIGRFGPTIWALIPLAYVVCGFKLTNPGAIRRRTRKGRDIWSRAGGFKRMLSTPSSELRFDFSARKEFFLPYLPYAVAFGCAKEWSAKYADEMDEPPPTPDWINLSNQRLTMTALTATGGGIRVDGDFNDQRIPIILVWQRRRRIQLWQRGRWWRRVLVAAGMFHLNRTEEFHRPSDDTVTASMAAEFSAAMR